jgi:hypothetical protein
VENRRGIRRDDSDRKPVGEGGEVGTKTEISPVIDCVVLLQKSYSIEHVARCRQKPQEDAGRKFFPTLFHGSPDAAEPGARGQGLDIRTVDREVLEMAIRFYTLTEPMVRSALANDLCEELPFEFQETEHASFFSEV